MIGSKKFIVAIISVLIVAGVANAGMSDVSQLGMDCAELVPACTDASIQTDSPIIADLDSLFIEVSIGTDSAPTPVARDVQILSDDSGSFNLCLSALISLGLCGSAQVVKKSSFDFVPEWYHNDGVMQIGHSYALLPNCQSPVPACCFIQPVSTVTDPFSQRQYHLSTITPLWRDSQFTPCVLASRGPPASHKEDRHLSGMNILL